MTRYNVAIPNTDIVITASTVGELKKAAGKFACAHLVDEKYGDYYQSDSEGTILISDMHPCHLRNAVLKHLDNYGRRSEVVNMVRELAKRANCTD